MTMPPLITSSGRPYSPVRGRQHRDLLSTGGMPGDKYARRIGIVIRRLAVQPADQSPTLTRDLRDGNLWAKRVIHHGNGDSMADQPIGHHAEVLGAVTVPIASVYEDKHWRARLFGRKDIDRSVRGRAVADVQLTVEIASGCCALFSVELTPFIYVRHRQGKVIFKIDLFLCGEVAVQVYRFFNLTWPRRPYAPATRS